MNCYYHDLDGDPRPASTQCERYQCGKMLCTDCNYDGRCYEHALASFNVDYGISHGRKIRVWIFTIAITIVGIIALISSMQPQEGYGVYEPGNSPTVLLLIPLIPLGAFFFYMGMSWIYEHMRGRGLAAGGFYVPGVKPTGLTGTFDNMFAWLAVLFVITILFVFVSWIVMIIGLATGIQKYKIDNRVIAAYNNGPGNTLHQYFPNNYIPLRYRRAQPQVEEESA